MKTKSSFIITIASVSIVLITLVVLALNLMTGNASGEIIEKNVLSDVILLICIFIFGAIVVMRGPAGYDKRAMYDID